MTEEKEVLKDLLIDESEIQKNLIDLVKKLKDIFQIQQTNGQIHFKDFGKLTNPARISALLIGKKIAKKLDLNTDDSLTITQIGNELGIPATTLSSPMKDLVKKGYVLKNSKGYEIAYYRLSEIIDEYFGDKNES